MSQEWMKIEKTTPMKPEILRIASMLGISRYEAFVRCFSVWCYFDTHSVDGEIPASAALIDDLAGLLGFAPAMIEVGWLLERSGSVSIPNFDYHLGNSAKRRSLNARRVARHASKKNDIEELDVSLSDCARTQLTQELTQELTHGALAPLISSKSGSVRERKTFKTPTVEEVRAYCAERGAGVDGDAWYDHYTANGWKVGKNSMKDWKASVRTWERNNGFKSTGPSIGASEFLDLASGGDNGR